MTQFCSFLWLNNIPYCVCVWGGASRLVLVVKNPPANAGKLEDPCSLPGSGRSPWGGHGNPLQNSCLENPMEGGAWKAIVHRVAKSRTWQHTHTHTHTHTYVPQIHERWQITQDFLCYINTHIFFIHSSVDGHLVRFHVLAIINNCYKKKH